MGTQELQRQTSQGYLVRHKGWKVYRKRKPNSFPYASFHLFPFLSVRVFNNGVHARLIVCVHRGQWTTCKSPLAPSALQPPSIKPGSGSVANGVTH